MKQTQTQNSTWVDPWLNDCPLTIPEAIAWMVEETLAGRDHGSYIRPAKAEHVHRCSFCQQLILPCMLPSGRWYDANCFVDETRDKLLCVNIYAVHACAESVRYAEFLRSETEEPGEE
jgi:hypothetical protein